MGKQNKMLYISPLLWYNLCHKGGEIYVRTRDTGNRSTIARPMKKPTHDQRRPF
jgi:hypothetical protein